MYSFRLTEEISRWAFEIICKGENDWYVAFTNPTAGPWKTIKGLNKSGKEGEVYRFELEETRPDIVLVNDKLKIIIIVEAKDSIEKLTYGDQAEKSVEVVDTLTSILKGCGSNPYWNERSKYPVFTGLLWGAETPTSAAERSNTFNEYYQCMKKYPQLNKDAIIGIETRRKGDGLQCFFCSKTYVEKMSITPDAIGKSFGLPTI